MAATQIALKPLDPAAYKATSMGGAASGPPGGFTLSSANIGLNVSAPQHIGASGHSFVPPISGSNVLIPRRIY